MDYVSALQLIIPSRVDSGSVRVFELDTGVCLHIWEHDDAVTAIVAWENMVFSSSNDRTIREWSNDKEAMVSVYQGAMAAINCLCLVHEIGGKAGRLLVGGCADGAVVCWQHGASDKDYIVSHRFHQASVNHMRTTHFTAVGDADSADVVALVSADAAGQV